MAAALVLLVGGSIALASQSLKNDDGKGIIVGAPPPPPLTILPPSTAITRADSVDLTAVAPANLRGDQQYEVRIFVNNKPIGRMALPAQDQFKIANVPLAEGDNTIRATLAGDGGESAPSPTVAVTRDDVAPQIKILQPTERVYTDTETLLGTTEPGADIQISDATGHDVASTVSGNGRFSADLTLHVGNNDLTVHSTDPAGNHSTVNVTVVRASSAASIDLTVTPSELYTAALPADVQLEVNVRDELGRPAPDGTQVVFGVSPPDRETTTYSASTSNGRARFTNLSIGAGDASGAWLVTALVTLPSGIELRDDAAFSLLDGAPKSPGQH